MPEAMQKITLLNGAAVEVRFIWRFAIESGPAYYPQAVRAWPKERSEKLRPEYQAVEPIYAAQLAALVQDSFDYLFAPPSRYTLAATYREACKEKHAGALDISGRFRKVDGRVVAGENDVTVKDVYRSLAYDPAGDEAGITSVLMVDDVVAGMKTTIAAFSRLLEAGMRPDVDITVASLLRARS